MNPFQVASASAFACEQASMAESKAVPCNLLWGTSMELGWPLKEPLEAAITFLEGVIALVVTVVEDY
jgi:hypothetical protein